MAPCLHSVLRHKRIFQYFAENALTVFHKEYNVMLKVHICVTNVLRKDGTEI